MSHRIEALYDTQPSPAGRAAEGGLMTTDIDHLDWLDSRLTTLETVAAAPTSGNPLLGLKRMRVDPIFLGRVVYVEEYATLMFNFRAFDVETGIEIEPKNLQIYVDFKPAPRGQA